MPSSMRPPEMWSAATALGQHRKVPERGGRDERADRSRSVAASAVMVPHASSAPRSPGRRRTSSGRSGTARRCRAPRTPGPARPSGQVTPSWPSIIRQRSIGPASCQRSLDTSARAGGGSAGGRACSSRVTTRGGARRARRDAPAAEPRVGGPLTAPADRQSRGRRAAPARARRQAAAGPACHARPPRSAHQGPRERRPAIETVSEGARSIEWSWEVNHPGPGGVPFREQAYWARFEVGKDGIMRVSARLVSQTASSALPTRRCGASSRRRSRSSASTASRSRGSRRSGAI